MAFRHDRFLVSSRIWNRRPIIFASSIADLRIPESFFRAQKNYICMPCQSISSISENQQRYLARIRENRLFYIFFRAMIFFFLICVTFHLYKKKKKTIRLVFVIKGPIGAISFPEFRLRRSRSDLFVG